MGYMCALCFSPVKYFWIHRGTVRYCPVLRKTQIVISRKAASSCVETVGDSGSAIALRYCAVLDRSVAVLNTPFELLAGVLRNMPRRFVACSRYASGAGAHRFDKPSRY